MDEVMEKFVEIFKRRARIQDETIDMEGDLAYDYDMDSLDIVGALMELDKAFKIKLPKNNINNIRKVRDLYTLLEEGIRVNG
ncbi:MAG: acyl carrier protein [Bacillota bacterium]|nr:acyl carrier protein [Bacillota bacterium]